MSRTAAEYYAVAKKRSAPPEGQPPGRYRLEIRADPAWLARVEDHARRLGINITAYVKLAISERLAADDAKERRDREGR